MVRRSLFESLQLHFAYIACVHIARIWKIRDQIQSPHVHYSSPRDGKTRKSCEGKNAKIQGKERSVFAGPVLCYLWKRLGMGSLVRDISDETQLAWVSCRLTMSLVHHSVSTVVCAGSKRFFCVLCPSPLRYNCAALITCSFPRRQTPLLYLGTP